MNTAGKLVIDENYRMHVDRWNRINWVIIGFGEKDEFRGICVQVKLGLIYMIYYLTSFF